MATINGLYILIETEDPNYANEVTEQPVEKGVSISDHVQRLGRSMAVSGYVVGPNASKIRADLINLSDKGKLVHYVGRNSFVGVITELTTSHTYQVANGYAVSFTLKEIRVAETSAAGKLPAPIRSQAAPIINSGTKKKKTKADSKKKKKSSSTKKSKAKSKKEKEKTQKVKFKPGSKWG